MALELGQFFDRLERQLESTPTLRRKISVNLAEETIDLIKEGFDLEKDPYGDPWAPKQKRDGRKVLSGETSNLKTSWHTRSVDEDGYEVAPSVDYAGYHQKPYEARRPRRMMFPDDELGLPQVWTEAFEETVLEVMHAHFTE